MMSNIIDSYNKRHYNKFNTRFNTQINTEQNFYHM